jgi:hypothetical protein
MEIKFEYVLHTHRKKLKHEPVSTKLSVSRLFRFISKPFSIQVFSCFSKMATSSASIADLIMGGLSKAAPAAAAASAAPAVSAAPASAAPAAAPSVDVRQPPLGHVEYSDGWGYDDGCGYGEDDCDSDYFNTSGQITLVDRLRAKFAQFDLEMSDVIRMMTETSMVIGGGFMVNHILAMNGIDKPLCPASDIDFYVYGGIPPILSATYGSKEYFEHISKSIQARAFRLMVSQRFHELVAPLGYQYTHPDEDAYKTESATDGDRVFTSRSNIRMSVDYYTTTINGVRKTLNLVFCNTDMYTFIQKVDISLTAGFFCPSTVVCDSFDYHHAAPNDVIAHRLAWMQPESTHTPRQLARMTKYRLRYDLLEQKKMTTAEFIRDWDALPAENLHITLVGTEDEMYSTAVVRRVTGLPQNKFSVEMKNSSTILGLCTTYRSFPSPSEIAEYERYKAKQNERRKAEDASTAAAAAAGLLLGTVKRPGLVDHDDDEEDA